METRSYSYYRNLLTMLIRQAQKDEPNVDELLKFEKDKAFLKNVLVTFFGTTKLKKIFKKLLENEFYTNYTIIELNICRVESALGYEFKNHVGEVDLEMFDAFL